MNTHTDNADTIATGSTILYCDSWHDVTNVTKRGDIVTVEMRSQHMAQSIHVIPFAFHKSESVTFINY